MRDSIHYDYKHSQVDFEASSLTDVMKTALGFSVSVESSAAPSKWYQLYDLDCRRSIYHYLRWHTTALQIADFQFVGTDQKLQFFDADRNSMLDAIDNLMRNTLIGQVVSDRQGKVWMEVEAKAYPNPTGSFTSVMDITKRDWMGEPSIDERLSDDTSFLELGGVAYTGILQNTFSAIIASAPGNAPSFRGKMDTRSGLALSSQSQLNTMVGNVWANDNSKYPKISMDMALSLRNLDIAPQETTFISIQPSDTVRNKLIEELYIPNGFDWKYDSKNQILLPSIEFKNLVNGNIGDSVEVPVSPADAGINGGFSVPGLQIPPLPILTIPPSYGGVSTTVIEQYQADYGLYRRDALLNVISQSSRGIVMVVSALTATTVSVQFNIAKQGVYQCNMFFTADIFIDADAPNSDAQLSFSNDSGNNDTLVNFAQASANTLGASRLSGSLSGVLLCNMGAVCLANVTVGSEVFTDADTTFYCSMVRISQL